MNERMSEIVYSITGDTFYEDLDSTCDDLEIGIHEIFQGESEHPKVSDFFDADSLIERIQENAYDNHDEYAEDYLEDVTKSQKEDLEKLICDWFEKNDLTPRFYRVINVEKIKVEVTESGVKEIGPEEENPNKNQQM